MKDNIFSKITEWDDYSVYNNEISDSKSVKLAGAFGSCADFIVASLESQNEDKKIIYLLPNDFRAHIAYENLNALTGGEAVLLERAEYMFYDAIAKSEETDYKRVEAERRIAGGDFRVLVLSVASAIQYLLPKEAFADSDFVIKRGNEYDIPTLTEKLSALGYVRTPNVSGKRQFSLRGDILDIYPTSAENPIRIEFFGDTVDTIRIFDPITQRSTEEINEASVLGESELRIGLGLDQTLISDRIDKALSEKQKITSSFANAKKWQEQIEHEKTLLLSGVDYPGRDRMLPFVIGRENTVFSWLSDAIVFAEDKAGILSAAAAINEEHRMTCMTLSENSCVLPDVYNFFMSENELKSTLEKRPVTYFEEFEYDGGVGIFSESILTLKFVNESIIAMNGNETLISHTLSELSKRAYPVYFLSDKHENAKKIIELLENKGDVSNFVFAKGGINQGFISDTLGISVVSQGTFYSGYKKQKKYKKANAIENFAEIEVGDYVVHDVHGIGIFEGLFTKERDGVLKEYVVVRYADNGRIWLPSFQLDSLSKYIGSDDYIPRVNTLGGRDWTNQKEKVKKQLREYVRELVELYAQRMNIEGYACLPDDAWQRDFEADFDFEPTDDQITSTAEIKSDMESPKPMERLLCGDVGFGKTEVALRAAFKAVMNGKQVAFLCPTTVLCQQHYKTVFERFQKFPVNVDYISRFRTAKEKKLIFERLKNGEIDILIGTHSILQKSAEFKELGLIIVDEEQRFGVLQKEKLKQKWPRADVLYLSATPIPRTLNMSLSKIRDISLLTDPPKMRNPVQTYVTTWDKDIIKNAIYRELARHGQVFYLFNSVQRMNEKLEQLQKLVPEAKIAIANGQMPERALEDVMQKFIDKEYDVLLCSAIIESGLDIPNANTIIVENGHMLGLAQLYQIRGRVGRSDRRAYAYITIPQNLDINPDAEKRLATIKEFTEFGSGFKVAMRDLQIRGAGSVLGERQHGEVAAIGYDMYCKLLNQMILEATGEAVPEEEVVINIELTVDAYIPDSFAADNETKMELYKKIAAVGSENDITELTDELIDRFGDVPKNVYNLMKLSMLRSLAAKAGIRAINQNGEKVLLSISEVPKFDNCLQNNFAKLNKNYRGKFNVMNGDKDIYGEFYFSSRAVLINQDKIIDEIKAFLECLSFSEEQKSVEK